MVEISEMKRVLVAKLKLAPKFERKRRFFFYFFLKIYSYFYSYGVNFYFKKIQIQTAVEFPVRGHVLVVPVPVEENGTRFLN